MAAPLLLPLFSPFRALETARGSARQHPSPTAARRGSYGIPCTPTPTNTGNRDLTPALLPSIPHRVATAAPCLDPYLAGGGEVEASGGASWGTAGAAGGAGGPGELLCPAGSARARSAGEAAGHSGCAAAPFAAGRGAQRTSAAPCGSSGAPSAAAASAAPTGGRNTKGMGQNSKLRAFQRGSWEQKQPVLCAAVGAGHFPAAPNELASFHPRDSFSTAINTLLDHKLHRASSTAAVPAETMQAL